MFRAHNSELLLMSKLEPYLTRTQELETMFDGATNIYIDYANVKHWADKLGWHINLQRLKNFLDSFNTVVEIKIYLGKIPGDLRSKALISDLKKYGYVVKTKNVKNINISIDVSCIPDSSTAVLGNLIKRPLLEKLKPETISMLNKELRNLNMEKIYYLSDRKCNFDVEIGRDMLRDYDKCKAENFILWSADSDFEDPVRQLLLDNKKVVVFATARRVSKELSNLASSGLYIYDIKKIRNFICKASEKKDELFVNAKREPIRIPQAIDV